MIHGSINDLANLLTLQAVGGNSFSAPQVADARSRVYGGQFLGQGLSAASRVHSGVVASFHCYYLRAGSTDGPLTYHTEAGNGALVTVQAMQNDRLLFAMDVMFTSSDRLPAPPRVPMPVVAPPASCIPRAEGIQGLDTNTDSTWAVTDGPFDYRFVENIWEDGYVEPAHNVWFRARDPGPLSAALPQTMQQAIAAYFCDDPIMDNALFPHGWHRAWTELQTASLDHAMWFHAPLDLRSWLLFAQDSPVAAGGRAITRGLMYEENGTLVASACQEILLRSPRGNHG